MNQVRQIQALNKREIEAGISTSASWHADYRDTAYVYIGGLSYDLSEGDIVTIFSQYGEPVHINLVRDKETGKSKGFAFLKYEDQRSTDLAVDNLGGATVLGRTLRVDHSRYKKKDDEEIYDNTGGPPAEEPTRGQGDDDRKSRRKSESEDERPLLKEERELQKLMLEHDDEDPMKEYLLQEKREEVDRAIQKYESDKRKDKKHHRHERHHRHSLKRDAEKDRKDYDNVVDKRNGESRRQSHRDREDPPSDRREKRHRRDRSRERSASEDDRSRSHRR